MKITLNDVGNLIDATTAKNTINTNSATIETAFENTLSRDGTAPNTMSAPLDMDSNQIINLPAPATTTSPLRLEDLNTFIGGGTISNIPTGGTTGQVLGKNSNTSFDTGWKNSVTSVGLSLPASDFTVTNSPVTTSGTLTGAWVVAPTGTGAVVRATSPTLVAPAMSNPAITGVMAYGGVTINAAVTGTGNMVLSNSPTLVTPALGTPASGVATNLTGTAAGLTAGNVTTNANLTGPITSVGNATSIASQTGTGTKFVVDTAPTLASPVLTTPVINGTITGTTVIPVARGGTGVTTAADLKAIISPTTVCFTQTVNFNAGNTDTIFPITLPTGFTRYCVSSVRISGASASLTTATAGVFTASAGGGVAVVTAASAITVSSTADATNNNTMAVAINNSNTTTYTLAGNPNLYFRVATPQGSTATAGVTIAIAPVP